MNNLRDRLSQMSQRMIFTYKAPDPLRLYKFETITLDDNFYQRVFNKEDYLEFTGIIIDISPQELRMIYDSNLFDLQGLSKLYTSDDIIFNLQDRISIGDNYYEIVSIDSSIGYQTLILKDVVWK
ncbi:DUF1506 family protein [Borrelia puertoricensis]|uniref:DUF1506 family protein n=1 Tax=Borrelia puertoricensis TaxID=2756107 RepID=UPI001FF16823|nr:DUF1506 family protein [Borrelia puertoricensis]UPA18512.1 DUF1506 family protein [Borrelia puertoricensis]